MPARRAGAYYRKGGSRFAGAGIKSNHSDYSLRSQGNFRHEYLVQNESSQIDSGDYLLIDLAKFVRSYTSGVDDVPPDPRANSAVTGNNIASDFCFNGSRLSASKFRTTIQSSMTSTDVAGPHSIYLEAYAIMTSFYDVLIWNTLSPTTCPVEMETVSPTDAGEITQKSTAPLITPNAIRNSRLTQRYMKYLGRVEVPQGENAEVNLTLPPKCRRANVGMYFGLMLLNPSDLNSAEHFQGSVSTESSFSEYLSDVRPPWKY